MKLETVTDAATRWGISPRRVRLLCEQGRVKGAQKLSMGWVVPSDAPKPVVGKSGPKPE